MIFIYCTMSVHIKKWCVSELLKRYCNNATVYGNKGYRLRGVQDFTLLNPNPPDGGT